MVKSKEKKDEETQQDTPIRSPYYKDRLLNKRNSQEEEESPSLWLVTFTDIMALMLTFFVLLYSMSVPKEEEWKEVSSAFEKGFSKFKSAKWYGGNQDSINISKLDFSNALDLDYLEAVVREIMAKDEKLQNVIIIPQTNRLVLSLPADLLFETGSADVNAQGKRALFALGGPLSRIRNRVEVVGHADPRPIQSKDSKFKTNWELSLMRAANVAGVLENVGYVRPIIVRGLSSGRYDELSTDTPEEERLNLSRRVDVVIMKDDGSQRLLMQLGG